MGPSSTSSQLSGAVIAVMGAGSGIGKEVVAELMNVGTRLSLADLRKEAVEEQAQAICASGGNCIAFEVDIRDTQAVDKWIEETVKVFGRLDGAIYRKNPEAADPILTKSDEEWQYVLDVNLSGTFRCMRAELASMKDGGSIVNVSSVVGMMGLPMDAPYCVSKHGIIGLTKTAAKEMAAQKIRINCVAPSAIETPMLGPNSGRTRDQLMKEIASHTPLNRVGTTSEVAKTICFLLSSDSSFTTGSVYTIDGGMTS